MTDSADNRSRVAASDIRTPFVGGVETGLGIDDAMHVVRLNRIERNRRESAAVSTAITHLSIRNRPLPVVAFPSLQDDVDSMTVGGRLRPRLSRRTRDPHDLTLPSAGLAPRWGVSTISDLLSPSLERNGPPSGYRTPRFNYAKQRHLTQPPALEPKKTQAAIDERQALPLVTLKRRQSQAEREDDFVIRRRSSPPRSQGFATIEAMSEEDGYSSSEEKLPYLPAELPDELVSTSLTAPSTQGSNAAAAAAAAAGSNRNWPLAGVSLIAPRRSKMNQQVDALLSFQNNTLSSPFR